ncbi:hypothetical protein A1O3_03957 [Capronia epimyces CBS 606.96]|uniref:Major facilitator superfamily (MFS) profile domain-containing protein n=1 Tax=Capronia epimyces CBS 606.96 TaxID=1182542 RepID=W9YBH3_9EURO|nr:uncharacterized protein A1O3_03957 [Capronia epimyces CBS 606.96]EXJ87000.1 hypothetical protein A1O3_03957 [Capronia epimyces CBS 606.96]
MNPLYPTPTDDPMDPLNWSAWRKNICIATVMFSYFLFTYVGILSYSFARLNCQAEEKLRELNMVTYTQVNWTLAIPSLGLAVGPLFWSSFADIYGRRIIMITGTCIAIIATGCSSLHNISLGGYMATRFFQGFGASPAATVGLSIINDLSFEHQRGFRVGLWVLAIDMGTYTGVLIGGFLALVDQYWVQYHVIILFAVLLVLEVVFLPETLYPRSYVLAHAHDESTAVSAAQTSGDGEKAGNMIGIGLNVKRTRQLGYLYVGKIPAVNHPNVWETLIHFGYMWRYPTVVLPVLMYVFFQYWWCSSILTMLPAAYEDYKVDIQGLFVIGLMLGTVIAEVAFSGRLSDWLVARLAAKNGGTRVPEMRLWLAYPGAVFSAVGLLVWGLSIARSWHWITGQVASFIFAAGLQMGNTVISSYIVDNYPDYAIDIITFYSVILNLSAFAEPWFINYWVEASGYTWAFAAQTMITAFGIIIGIGLVQLYGGRIRAWSGAPSWTTASSRTEL